MDNTETQNNTQQTQTPEGQGGAANSETPNQQNEAAKIKELERQLSDSNTARATMEARYTELDNEKYNSQQQVQEPSTIENLADQFIKNNLEDEGKAKESLVSMMQENRDNTLADAHNLIEGTLAMRDIKDKYPNLAPLQGDLNNEAYVLMNSNRKYNYKDALSEVAANKNDLIEKIVQQRLEGQQNQNSPQEQLNGPSGMMNQGPPSTPRVIISTPTLTEEMGSKNRSLSSKLL